MDYLDSLQGCKMLTTLAVAGQGRQAQTGPEAGERGRIVHVMDY
jgi:hypothetical protein